MFPRGTWILLAASAQRGVVRAGRRRLVFPPQSGERRVVVLQFAGGQAQKRKRAPGPKDDAGGGALLVGIDHSEFGVCADYDRALTGGEFARVIPVIDARAIFPKVDDET